MATMTILAPKVAIVMWTPLFDAIIPVSDVNIWHLGTGYPLRIRFSIRLTPLRGGWIHHWKRHLYHYECTHFADWLAKPFFSNLVLIIRQTIARLQIVCSITKPMVPFHEDTSSYFEKGNPTSFHVKQLPFSRKAFLQWNFLFLIFWSYYLNRRYCPRFTVPPGPQRFVTKSWIGIAYSLLICKIWTIKLFMNGGK